MRAKTFIFNLLFSVGFVALCLLVCGILILLVVIIGGGFTTMPRIEPGLALTFFIKNWLKIVVTACLALFYFHPKVKYGDWLNGWRYVLSLPQKPPPMARKIRREY